MCSSQLNTLFKETLFVILRASFNYIYLAVFLRSGTKDWHHKRRPIKDSKPMKIFITLNYTECAISSLKKSREMNFEIII